MSAVLPVREDNYSYLHRGTNHIAFRLPNDRWLTTLLKQTGPLVAPSANLEGKASAKTITAAQRYFGNSVDFYLDRGSMSVVPSTLVTFENRKIVVLRRGTGRVRT